LEFHVHTNASLLALGAMLAHNQIGKIYQSVASRLLNQVEWNYIMTKWKALTMVHALHKFWHSLLGNKFISYVNHMVLIYLFNKPQVSKIIVKWFLLFLKYDFKVLYKHG
jgi:hypothetical protein